jgi:hypothetical protein
VNVNKRLRDSHFETAISGGISCRRLGLRRLSRRQQISKVTSARSAHRMFFSLYFKKLLNGKCQHIVYPKNSLFRLKHDEKRFDVSPLKVESIITNKDLLSTQAVALSLEHNIDIVFLDGC